MIRRLSLAPLALLIVGCASTVTLPPSASPPVGLPTASAETTAPATTAPAEPTPPVTVEPTVVVPQALAGIVDLRPDGWFYLSGADVPGFASTFVTAYGPDGEDEPPEEGPGRLLLYETFHIGDAYFQQRVDQAKRNGAHEVSVEVNGESATAWVTDSTGELLLGWEVPGKSEVLVANRADYTVKQLVASAESVSDCCG